MIWKWNQVVASTDAGAAQRPLNRLQGRGEQPKVVMSWLGMERNSHRRERLLGMVTDLCLGFRLAQQPRVFSGLPSLPRARDQRGRGSPNHQVRAALQQMLIALAW